MLLKKELYIFMNNYGYNKISTNYYKNNNKNNKR